MRLFLVQLIGSTLFGALAVAEHQWPGSNDYYGYRGPPAPLSSDGRVIDTPEVAHARAAHLATHAEVAARISQYQHHPVWEESVEEPGSNYVEPPRPYRGPLAPLDHDGRVIDTPEVAEAKAAHMAAHANAAAKASLDYDYHGLRNDIWDDRSNQHDFINNQHPAIVPYAHFLPTVYRGPPAPLAPDGRVLDTPEVAQAKEAHLRAHAYAAALAAHREHQLYYPKH